VGDWRRLLGSFEEVVAFRTPVDRLVLLNDGTQADLVANALRVPPARVSFLMHGVDFEACDRARSAADSARAALGVANDQPLLVSASRLTGWKRVDRIIRLMPLVLERHPDAVLAISGDGPSTAELESLSRELGVHDSVRFLGALQREPNLELISAADVFCSFFDFSNVGVSLLEALSCGVAVVTLATGATKDVVHDGVNGVVLEDYDTDAAAAVVNGLLDDRALRSRLATRAYDQAREALLDIGERKRLEVELVEAAARR
jgi:glycosyltransferase involved in cell wall biosynthesis